MSVRTLVIVLIGAGLGLLTGCFCPGSGRHVPSGSFVFEERLWAQAYNVFEGAPSGYELSVDEAQEEVVEVFQDELGTHVARYRVVSRSSSNELRPSAHE